MQKLCLFMSLKVLAVHTSLGHCIGCDASTGHDGATHNSNFFDL